MQQTKDAMAHDAITAAGLKKRGWTDAAIARFAPQPDLTKANPHYRAGPPMRLYLVPRIVEIEGTNEFQDWFAQSARRKEATSKGVETKIQNMVEFARRVPLTIEPGLTDDEIYQLARSTHGGNYAGDPGFFVWSNKTARNCIRHNLTNYEELWAHINRGYTGETAYRILRRRIDKLVKQTYPQFAKDEPESPPTR